MFSKSVFLPIHPRLAFIPRVSLIPVPSQQKPGISDKELKGLFFALILRVVCASFYGNPCLKRNERYRLSCYLLGFFWVSVRGK
ncbi:MAG: hypothetical protein Ct9H90mP27_3320 [Gammaproteobacteria bacterium]|nr:MAG: hypothetical protein Ct9H90mP27_3320 [Gammaproteobacteria bacterium]